MIESGSTLKQLFSASEAVIAPLVLDPMMALLARQAGFKALYLGGGAMGYRLTATEANLTLTEMAEMAIQIKSVCDLPLILDGTCGWGDPMHQHRTIGMAEAAGFQAIEIEDQLLPKRAHHHAGKEHCIPVELMVEKVREAVRARKNRDFVIIARTNIARSHGWEEAAKRLLAFKEAGADMLLPMWVARADVGKLAARLPAPLMLIAPTGGLTDLPMAPRELAALGFRLIVDSMTPLLSIHRTLRRCYEALAKGHPDPNLGDDGPAEHDAVLKTIDLEKLLEIERRTVET